MNKTIINSGAWLLLLVVQLLYSAGVFAQPPATSGLLDVPVLTGRTAASTVQPNLGPINFDKKMKVVSTTSRGAVETCLFLNTRMGIIGYFTREVGSTGSCSINPNEDGFNFNVITLKGNTYNYVTSEKQGVLEKRVVTHNSDFYYSSWSSPGGGSGIMRKLNERGSYAGGSISTFAYQLPGTGTVHLYGSSYPAQLTATPNAKHLGTLGVGYTVIQNKVYLVMEVTAGDYFNSAIMSVENTNTSFNTSDFAILEDEFYTKGMEEIRREERKIMSERPSSGSCGSPELQLKNFRLAALGRKKAWLEKTKQGNSMTDKPTQEAYVKVMGYDDAAQQMIYELELGLCKLDESYAQGGIRPDDYNRKKNCYQANIMQMHDNKRAMKDVERRYPNELGRQFQEKTRLLMRGIELCD
jgi:hypothetical protein